MSVSMTMNGAVLPILAMYIVAAEEQVVSPCKLILYASNSFNQCQDYTPINIKPIQRCILNG
jgi:methylmalonyl-CoA mutase N-terminal domain/subunit